MYKQGNTVNNVSNLDAFDIRSYCKLIEEEHTMSSRPLIDHICAICGGLLQPGFGHYSSIEQTGRAGIPYQVRGQRCAWDALPPSCYCFQSVYWLVDFHLFSKSLKMSASYSKLLLHNCRGCITNLDERLTKMHRLEHQRRHMNIYWIRRILGGIVVPVSDIIIKKQTFCRVLVE